MKKCTVLVGVPGSGKSTWLRHEFTENLSPAFVASTDSIIESTCYLHGLTYDQAFKHLIGFAEVVMWKELKLAATEGVNLYIDRTNLSVKTRKKFLDFLKPFGYDFDAVVFNTPEKEEWARRLDERPGKTIPRDVLDGMVSTFIMPTEAEGFSRIIQIPA